MWIAAARTRPRASRAWRAARPSGPTDEDAVRAERLRHVEPRDEVVDGVRHARRQPVRLPDDDVAVECAHFRGDPRGDRGVGEPGIVAGALEGERDEMAEVAPPAGPERRRAAL